jgi:hypothetical protein
MEAVMRTIALVAFTLATFALAGGPARADGPWCAYDVRGGTNCGFHTYAQCMAHLSGIGGTCSENPAYTGRRRR